MAVERSWFYERIASPSDGDGRICLVCKQELVDESQPGYWVLKAVEDNQDADFIVEDGYTHHACTQKRLAEGRKGALELPPVPDLPGSRP